MISVTKHLVLVYIITQLFLVDTVVATQATIQVEFSDTTDEFTTTVGYELHYSTPEDPNTRILVSTTSEEVNGDWLLETVQIPGGAKLPFYLTAIRDTGGRSESPAFLFTVTKSPTIIRVSKTSVPKQTVTFDFEYTGDLSAIAGYRIYHETTSGAKLLYTATDTGVKTVSTSAVLAKGSNGFYLRAYYENGTETEKSNSLIYKQ